jgi:transposase
MLYFFGGSSAIYVPDNLKSGITRPCRYEPGINRTYEEMAAHYGAVVIPARVRRPKDKPKAELSVLLAQRWILAVLRHRSFFSLAELNEAIWELLPRLNERKLQKLDVSRRDLFEQIDRPLLLPLPPQRYELGEWSSPRVNIDYHIDIQKNYYSVPYALVGEKVEARITATTVEIFFKDKRVASHFRKRGRREYSTVAAHMPAAHRAHLDWSPSRLIHWAEKTGPATAQVVTHILETRRHPEQGYRSCLGIMRLAKPHGADRLEAASARAIHLRSFSYQTIKNILASGTDRLPLDEETHSSSTPAHDNVRGPSYYDSKEVPC